jgi:hypothetical protein
LEDEDGFITVECSCSDLSVASLVEDVAGIFTENKNLQAILDISGGLGMLSEMKFWEFAMFWVKKFKIFFINYLIFFFFLN